MYGTVGIGLGLRLGHSDKVNVHVISSLLDIHQGRSGMERDNVSAIMHIILQRLLWHKTNIIIIV
jgi:hypothetical protein